MENIQEILDEALDKLSKEDFVASSELFKKVLKLDSNNFEAYKNLGLCEVNLDDTTSAIEAFEKANEINPEDATVLYYLACCKARIGAKEEAIDIFNKVLELRPDYLEAYKSLAMIYVEFAQVDSSIEIIEQALKNPAIAPDASLYYILATSYMLKKDHENAIVNLKLALEINPEYLSVMNSLANCYMNIADYDNALEVLLKAYEIDNQNSLTAYNLGICYQIKEDYKKALSYFQESYRLEPSATMLSSLAFCALKAGEYVLASNLYQNLVNAYPNNTEYRFSYIEALEASGDYVKALDNTNLLLSFDEKNVYLIKKRGTYLRKLGLYDESIETFALLLNRGKIDVEVYYNLAYDFVEKGDFDNAKEMFKKCIVLEPQNPYAHKDLGVLYLKMNMYDWAVDEMQEAINLDSSVSEFYYSLGVANVMLGEIEEAKKALLKAVELDSNDANAMAYLGYIYLLEKDYDSATDTLKEALRLDAANFLAKSHSAKLYFQLKKYDIAKEFLMDIIKETKDDETRNMLAICYLETNEYHEAYHIFKKLIETYPDNHILLTNLAKCEIHEKDYNSAKEHLRQALMIFDDYDEALKLLEEVNNARK